VTILMLGLAIASDMRANGKENSQVTGRMPRRAEAHLVRIANEDPVAVRQAMRGAMRAIPPFASDEAAAVAADAAATRADSGAGTQHRGAPIFNERAKHPRFASLILLTVVWRQHLGNLAWYTQRVR